jgi:drug/metabolite transporter (DMT)-like permease
VFLFLGFAFQTTGLVYTTPSRSAFLTGLSVLLVPFVALALFRHWPRPPTLLGVGLAVVGLYQLTGGLQGTASETWRGDLLTLGCAVAYAFQITLTERYAPRTKISALVATQLWTVTALSLVALAVGGGARLEPTWSLWGAVAFCGLIASAAAILVQTWAQARTTAVRAALIFSMEPVFAALTALWVGEEMLGWRELVGGALIVLAVVVAEVGNAAWARWRSTGSP